VELKKYRDFYPDIQNTVMTIIECRNSRVRMTSVTISSLQPSNILKVFYPREYS